MLKNYCYPSATTLYWLERNKNYSSVFNSHFYDEYGARGAGGRRGSGGASGRGGSGGASGSGGARGSGGLQCDPLGIGTSHTWHGSPDALCRTTPVTVQPLGDDESAVTCDAKLKLSE